LGDDRSGDDLKTQRALVTGALSPGAQVGS
jgi:hypothetical protein